MGEIRVEVGVKESVKKKWEMQTGKESKCPESGGQNEAREVEIAMGDCIKSDLESGRRM